MDPSLLPKLFHWLFDIVVEYCKIIWAVQRRGGKVIEERTRADGEKYIYKLQYGGKVLIVTEKKAVLDRLMPDITTTPIEAGNTEISQTAVEFMEVQVRLHATCRHQLSSQGLSYFNLHCREPSSLVQRMNKSRPTAEQRIKV